MKSRESRFLLKGFSKPMCLQAVCDSRLQNPKGASAIGPLSHQEHARPRDKERERLGSHAAARGRTRQRPTRVSTSLCQCRLQSTLSLLDCRV
eukprot:6209839-Pleurochrysis_carterae.AAC.1